MADEQPDRPGSAAPGAAPQFTVVRRGFARDQVLERLRQADARTAELQDRLEQALIDLAESRRELHELRREHAAAAGAEHDPYEGVSEHVMELVRAFDREVERLRRRAEFEATGVVAEARMEAARIRLEAQGAEERARAQVERLLGDARQEAERVRAQLAPLRELALNQARAIRDRMRLSLVELDAILPEQEDEQAVEPVIVLDEASDAPAPPLDVPPA
jgi:cell division septum initiation protein DivIVA